MQHELQLLKETSQMAYSRIQFNLGFYKLCLMPEISTNGTIARNVNLVKVKETLENIIHPEANTPHQK